MHTTPEAVLDAARDAQRESWAADVRLLASAAEWADLNGAVGWSSGLPGVERLVDLGGDGTPQVAEFAPAELGAVLSMSPSAAWSLVADALDLRHRLPLTWAEVRDLRVAPWMGRKVAQATRCLDRETVGSVDLTASRWADRLGWGRLAGVVEAAVIAADPDRAKAAADAAHGQHGVWVDADGHDGTKTAFVRADAADLDAFDTALDHVADTLADLGDASSRDERRARGLGVLADHQLSLDLGSPKRDATLYVHVTPDTIDGRHPVARVEGVGPVVADTAQRWLKDCNVTVKPVLDLAGVAPVDAYEIPDRLREAVHLLAPADAFPYASSDSRTADLDHTAPFQHNGPPGQTRVGNLAKLTRRHHRVKTHGRWHVHQPLPGVLVWQSPHGHRYLVDHTGTRHIA